MMNKIEFSIVDAFVISGKVFTGNPAAVIIIEKDNDIADELKQSIAAEFNASETAFVSKIADGKSNRRLIRWFTPTKEIELCGHATIGASHVLFRQNPQENVVQYLTKFGLEIDCRRETDGQLTLNFPVQAPFKLFPETNSSWLPALTEAVLGKNLATKVVDYQISPGIRKLVLRLDDDLPEEELAKFNPNYSQMLSLDRGDKDQIWGVMVTQKSNFDVNGLHFRSRFFAPWSGVNEDPVTGSAFTVLTPYWSKVYAESFNPVSVFQSLQASKRGGLVRSRIDGDRVFISGSAVEFSTGTITL